MPLSSDAVTLYRSGTVRGAAGFFRVARLESGRWSLLDPEERPVFLCAVNGIDSLDTHAERTRERLRRWHFNAIGAGSESVEAGEFPRVASVEFCAEPGPVIRASGIRLPDVFDASWAERAAMRAAMVCGSRADEKRLIGWLGDAELGWGPAKAGRPTLLQVCLSLEPGFAAYHAAWEFALAAHQGQFARLASAWGQGWANKESLREMTRSERGMETRGYARDNARWTREFARRYFSTTVEAIRAHDPNHLVLGAQAAKGSVLEASEASAAGADVSFVSWRQIGALAAGPVFVDDFNWTAGEFLQPGTSRRAGGLTTVERMLRRGRAALRRIVEAPTVVGYAWSHWRDRPGEVAPFGSGLVRADDSEAREHTELLADIQGRAASLRGLPVS